MKWYLVAFVSMLFVGIPVLAEEQTDSGEAPRPPFYLDAIKRAEKVKENIEEHQGMFKELLPQGGMVRPHPFQNASGTKEGFPGEGLRTRPHMIPGEDGMVGSTTGRFLERRQMLRDKLFERKEQFSSTTALRKAGLTEEMRERVLNRAEHAGTLFDAMLERLMGIAGRLEERLAALTGEGVDVSLAQTELDEAYDAIDAAETAINEVKNAMQTALESETPKEELEAHKSLLDGAKTALRGAHQALMEVAKALPKPEAETE